ncbi:hypothetical protein [Arthrobacter silvisoli]|uniref:hypothetical protein n=1 Tax=Arthrobacter silvisoli TaxID=2291022 RepID=UPI000E218F78|nr:hypothetical protein [Arthrobacter silvisoli]
MLLARAIAPDAGAARAGKMQAPADCQVNRCPACRPRFTCAAGPPGAANQSAAEEKAIGFDILELRNGGLEAIEALKKESPHKVVIVDLNGAAGEKAARRVFQAGADLVRVSGESEDSAIAGAVRAATASHHKGVVVDLSEVQDKWRRAAEVLKLGATFVEFLPGLMSKPSGASPLPSKTTHPHLAAACSQPLSQGDLT